MLFRVVMKSNYDLWHSRSLLWETEGLRGNEVSTVDGFQGREKVIILNMVRANTTGELTLSRCVNVIQNYTCVLLFISPRSQ